MSDFGALFSRLLEMGVPSKEAAEILHDAVTIGVNSVKFRNPEIEKIEARRLKDRERKAAQRTSSDEFHGIPRNSTDTEEIPSEVSPQTPLPTFPIPSLRSGTNGRARTREGWPADYREQFWALYPSKTAKKAGLKMLDRVAVSADAPEWGVLLAGLERYKRTKPTDWAWAHASTWLHGERWTDEPAEIIPINRKGAQNGVREATDILRDTAAQLRAEGPSGLGDGALRFDARFLPRPG